MRLAYLLSSYPMTSTTFIRREIEALEALGQPVARFAVRHWDTALVDPADIAEQGRTEYLLTGNAARLVAGGLGSLVSHAPEVSRALPLWWHVWRKAGGGLVRHVSYLLQAIRFRRRAAALGIDHVHVHFSTNAATVAMLAHAMGGPRYSFTVHGPDELVDPAAGALSAKVANAAFVVAITDYCRNRILAEAPDNAAKVRVIRCGIDLARFAPEPMAAATPGSFVCVGRLCANKAQVLIPEAVARVRARHPEVTVELVGGGEDEAAVREQVVHHHVGNEVRLAGWGTADEVRAAIGRSAVLLLPSYAEGLPIVIMEALAMGRPVLTTRIAGIPELVDADCGWVIEPGSIEQMAAAMAAALSASPARRAAMGQEGRRRVEQHHDLHKSASALLGAFRSASGAPAEAGAQVREFSAS